MTDAVFRTFIQRERQRLIRYVRTLFNEAAELDAEDVVHDVLVKLLERPGSSASLSDVSAYVYRSVKNRVIDYSRTRKSTLSLDVSAAEDGPAFVELLEDDQPTAIELLQEQENEAALFEALSVLSDIERQVVIAHEFEGVSFRELSDTLNIPQNTLLSHKSRALKKLKEYFLDLE